MQFMTMQDNHNITSSSYILSQMVSLKNKL